MLRTLVNILTISLIIIVGTAKASDANSRELFVPLYKENHALIVADNNVKTDTAKLDPVKAKTVRDPFVPYLNSAGVPASDNSAANGDSVVIGNSMSSSSLNAFRVTGVIKSKTKSIAVLKDKSQNEYYVTIGDKIGIEKAIITTIDKDGISINKGGNISRINVSNKFEIKTNGN